MESENADSQGGEQVGSKLVDVSFRPDFVETVEELFSSDEAMRILVEKVRVSLLNFIERKMKLLRKLVDLFIGEGCGCNDVFRLATTHGRK